MATQARINRWLDSCEDAARRTTHEITPILADLAATTGYPEAHKFTARAGKAHDAATALRTAIDALIRELHATTATPTDRIGEKGPQP